MVSRSISIAILRFLNRIGEYSCDLLVFNAQDQLAEWIVEENCQDAIDCKSYRRINRATIVSGGVAILLSVSVIAAV